MAIQGTPGPVVAVVGSRGYLDLEKVRVFVRALPKGTVVASGGADGVDKTVERTAWQAGFAFVLFPANWRGLGRAAGPIRNQALVAAADEVVAFWDGRSPGTGNVIDLTLRARKPLRVYGEGKEPVVFLPGDGAPRGRLLDQLDAAQDGEGGKRA